MTKRKVTGYVAIAVVVVLAGIQFIPIDRTNPPVTSEIDAPAEIANILRRACYDCHSNETQWPWYASVAPMSWLLADHVGEGRGHLNFSEWPAFDYEEQEHAYKEIREEVEKGGMPLRSYTWMHSAARLTDEERERLVRWARGFQMES